MAVTERNLNHGGALFDHFADAGTGANSSETDLYSDTIAAGQLATNGDKLQGYCSGTFLAHASNTRTAKWYFGGTALLNSTALATTATNRVWLFQYHIIRVDASTVRYTGVFNAGISTTQLAVVTASGSLGSLTLSNTQILKFTGTNSGTDTDGIKAQQASVRFIPAA